jgi:hypothetical protein
MSALAHHSGPKKRPRHYSYEEDVDEPPGLIEKEPFDVEAEVPAEENEPIENSNKEEEAPTPAYDEE